MGERHQKTLWPWILTTVVAVLILYPLSLGPAIWLQASGHWPASMFWADHVYDPLRWVIYHSPQQIQDAWVSYLTWWASQANMPQR